LRVRFGDADRHAVLQRDPALDRLVELVERRRIEYACHRTSLVDDGDADAPELLAAEKAAGAVDRIDDEQRFARQAIGAVFGFLRQPAVVRPGLAQQRLEDFVGGEIGGADGDRPSFFHQTSGDWLKWLRATAPACLAASAISSRSLCQRAFSTSLIPCSNLSAVCRSSRPASVIPSIAMVGAATPYLRSISLAGVTRMNISLRFDAMVTSDTAKVSSPFSIQKPVAPRLYSPVIMLTPWPISSVT
jgi:hypothetical protein